MKLGLTWPLYAVLGVILLGILTIYFKSLLVALVVTALAAIAIYYGVTQIWGKTVTVEVSTGK